MLFLQLDKLMPVQSEPFQLHTICGLRYGFAVWDGSSRINLNSVLLIQRRALRVMAVAGWRVSCREIFVERDNLKSSTCTCLKLSSWLPQKLYRNKGHHQYVIWLIYARNHDLHKSGGSCILQKWFGFCCER